MSLPDLPHDARPEELRKALVRLRLEMRRQELQHEASLLLQPAKNLADTLSFPGTTLGGATLGALSLLAGKRRGPIRLLRLGIVLYPLLRSLLRRK